MKLFMKIPTKWNRIKSKITKKRINTRLVITGDGEKSCMLSQSNPRAMVKNLNLQ